MFFPGGREPPNNWNSLFRFSAWEWSDIRQEYYLHQCIIEQPDLNYREPKVVQAMKDVLTVSSLNSPIKKTHKNHKFFSSG